MNHFIHCLLLCGCLLGVSQAEAQNTRRVLFLGNSYTDVNNLPQLTADVTASTGKTLIFDANAPGGYYLAQHLTNSTSLAKIAVGNWDNVVLQDQSMSMAYPSTYRNILPYDRKLDSVIKAQNLCAQVMFYSTWGRKNGDTYLCSPPECAVDTWIVRTYHEMDSTIGSHYKVFADSLKASVTPVGAVWRYLRQNNPSIELFQADESHPSLAGSYAAACSFYATLFRSDPTLITHNAGLSAADAAAIRAAAKQVVYNNLLHWNVGRYDSLLNSSCALLGVDNASATNEYWRVFPNPATDVLLIRFSASHVKDTLGIYNMLGVLIKEQEATQITRIDVSDLPVGLYMIKSMNDGHVLKVVKN